MHFKEIDIKNRVYKYCFDYLIRAKTSETKNIFIDEKNYKDIVICFTRYNRGKSMRMLSLHCHESVGKIKGKIYLMVDDSIFDKVLANTEKIIDIEKASKALYDE